MNSMHIQGVHSQIKYRNDDNFMNYKSHLAKNDEKGAKYSNNPNRHESTRISETHA